MLLQYITGFPCLPPRMVMRILLVITVLNGLQLVHSGVYPKEEYLLSAPNITGNTHVHVGGSTTLWCINTSALPAGSTVKYAFFRYGAILQFRHSHVYSVAAVTPYNDGDQFTCQLVVQVPSPYAPDPHIISSPVSNTFHLIVTGVPPCIYNPCLNGGSCTCKNNHVKCRCPPHYGGKHCQVSNLETITISGNTNLTEGDNTTLTCTSDINSTTALYQFFRVIDDDVTPFDPSASNQLDIGSVTQADDDEVVYFCKVIFWGVASNASNQIVLDVAPNAGGYAGGTSYDAGSAATILCLPHVPTLEDHAVPRYGSADIYGAEYETCNEPTCDMSVACAVCRTPRTSTLMLPAAKACLAGWTLEYEGYLMGGHSGQVASEFICVDRNMSYIEGTQGNDNGKLLYYSVVHCNSLSCPPYKDGKIVPCAFCSK